MSQSASKIALVFDTNVAIDYLDSAPVLLREISQSIGPVLLPDAVFEDIGQLNLSEWQRLGVGIVRISTARVHGMALQNGRLSWADHACLWLAVDQDGACVSNDERLRQECNAKNVPALWGLEPLAKLTRAGRITLKLATRVARRMQTANPYHISESAIRGFLDKTSAG